MPALILPVGEFVHPHHPLQSRDGACFAWGKRSVFTVALVVSAVAAVCAAIPALAGSDEGTLANQTGDDPTQPLGKIELLDRFTTAPGPGAVQGTTKQVETNTPFARIEAPFRIAPQWELATR